MQAKFAGENFFRYSGEAPEVQKLQLFAWNAAARGNDVHMNANPTAGQLLHHQYVKKKEEIKDSTKVSILSKYGGEEYLEKAPKELLQGQTEEYIEYSRTGQVIKGKERAKTRSKYPEDGVFVGFHAFFSQFVYIACAVYVNNHTGVWGSWYDIASGTWGYGCCHSSVHMSYCTGEAGIQAAQASSAKKLLEAPSSSSMPPPPPPAAAVGDTAEERKKKAEELFSKKRLGEGELSLDRDKLTKAINDERKRKARGDDDEDRFGKKPKGGLGSSHEVSEEELGMFYLLQCDRGDSADCTARRGIPDEPSDDRGSDGQLCGHRPAVSFGEHVMPFSGTFVSICVRMLLYVSVPFNSARVRVRCCQCVCMCFVCTRRLPSPNRGPSGPPPLRIRPGIVEKQS